MKNYLLLVLLRSFVLSKHGERMYPIHLEHSFRLDTHEIEIPLELPIKMDGFMFAKLRIG